ncbi:MAG TPA: FtsX-like permease family protein [Terracidiphilus sp.]|nr:FtsX-like permease family protein [Terracidiphilus sp.]
MAQRALSWRRAAAIGWRDLKSAPGKFSFVVLSVAVGVAALVGVRGFSESFRTTLTREARSLMAGDLSARIFRQPTQTELDKVAAIVKKSGEGAESTWAVETVSMASVAPDPVPLLVSLKAVDPAQYPYYGSAQLDPSISLTQALAGDSAVVADEFLIRLHAHVGQMLKLGGREFKITAVLKQEPDRMSAGAGLGPRVMISRASLDKTGLLAPGSRASERLLLKLPPTADAATVRKEIEDAMPDAQVMDFREGNPALSEGLEHATAMLSLICLVAMVLGAIGVAMAMHAHLEQRMDMLAILKAVGAKSSDLLRIFLVQTLGLGLAGALLGVAAGAGVMLLLPSMFARLLPLKTQLAFPWKAAAAGLGTGLLTTFLFCLPPLLDVRNIRPVLVLRRLVEQGPATLREWLKKWMTRWVQILLSVCTVVALGGIAWALSDSVDVAWRFAAAFAVTVVVLLALAAIALRVLRFTLNRVRLRLPSSLRHGLANLYRPGNQSAAVLAALGTGVMLILSVYLTQGMLLRDLRQTASPKLPNVFLIDITPDEVSGIREFFQHQQGVKEPLDLLPVVRGRVVTINGQPLDKLEGKHVPTRMLENAALSWADELPAGDKIREGKWWKSGDAKQIAVSEGLAKRLDIKAGSTMQMEIGGETQSLKVAAIYRADGQHLGARVSFVLPSGLLKDEVATWYGGAHIDPKLVGEMERGLFAAYPTVTVINIADVLDRIESVVGQITFVVRFLAGFSILAGLMILASSIASARFRRMREAVVLKTLGATRMRIVRTFSVEFSVLGLLAGAVGVIFANVLTRVLLRKMEIAFHVDWEATAVALIGTAVLATATGWIASYRILGLRPLEVLREE